jgi:hypothetical protein
VSGGKRTFRTLILRRRTASSVGGSAVVTGPGGAATEAPAEEAVLPDGGRAGAAEDEELAGSVPALAPSVADDPAIGADVAWSMTGAGEEGPFRAATAVWRA